MSEKQITYDLFIADNGVSVQGTGYTAFQFGKKYCENMNGGKRKIIISGKPFSYSASIPEDSFPSEVILQKGAPNMRIAEASHVTDCKGYTSQKSLDEFIKMLTDNGWKIQ